CTDEPGTQEQVFRRIAGDDQLGEEDDVDVLLLRLVEPIEHALRVSGEVAHDRVDLRKRKPQGLRLTVENLSQRLSAKTDRVEIVGENLVDPALELLGRIVLRVQVSAA